ncbi:MAG: hypothetical protein HQK51_18000 [Oligoflexia bacterium]|nr:hypothetical protein [Oligoflexia bacterium]
MRVYIKQHFSYEYMIMASPLIKEIVDIDLLEKNLKTNTYSNIIQSFIVRQMLPLALLENSYQLKF